MKTIWMKKMTAKEINESIGMSYAYLHALRNVSPDAYNFYVEYGNGDVVKGVIDSRDDFEALKVDVYELWVHHTETVGLNLKKLLEPIQEHFKSFEVSNVIVHRWITNRTIRHHKLRKKIDVLKTLRDSNIELLEKIRGEYK